MQIGVAARAPDFCCGGQSVVIKGRLHVCSVAEVMSEVARGVVTPAAAAEAAHSVLLGLCSSRFVADVVGRFLSYMPCLGKPADVCTMGRSSRNRKGSSLAVISQHEHETAVRRHTMWCAGRHGDPAEIAAVVLRLMAPALLGVGTSTGSAWILSCYSCYRLCDAWVARLAIRIAAAVKLAE